MFDLGGVQRKLVQFKRIAKGRLGANLNFFLAILAPFTSHLARFQGHLKNKFFEIRK